ncbi:uncharacterized protein LOC132201751 [Neocloeon triangulifer]|uniref:uncharacterized protein LOC132201751 n=1 Tax=Neocloeon triangulifer TaxID=2078957 RepID=UPI00286F5B29|nr:uncharacterized protein LOC132201751 [Neocloeon triangulifer]
MPVVVNYLVAIGGAWQVGCCVRSSVPGRSMTERHRLAMKSKLALLLLLATSAWTAPGAKKSSNTPTSEDFVAAPARDVVLWNQNQEGKINLQVSLKDVQIVALLNSDMYDDDSGGSDYDYSELEALINSTIAAAATSTTEKPSESEEGTTDDEPLLQLSEVLELAANESSKGIKGKNVTTPVLTPAVSFVANGKPENISQLPNDEGKKGNATRPEIYHREAPKRAAPKPACGEEETRDRLGRCRAKASKGKRRRPSARLAFPLKLNLQSLVKGFRLARLDPSESDWES